MSRETDFASARARLVEDLLRTGLIRSRSIERAFRRVPREEFVPPSERGHAYWDAPLPIPQGQTISAPSMIAIMLEESDLSPGKRVLEVGTGSGYNAALLACLVGPEHVVSLERLEALAAWGRSNLERTGFGAVRVVVGDGSLGHVEGSPYDCILATAGAPRIPDAWPTQLGPGGRIVAPIGESRHEQVLVVASRRPDGILDVQPRTPCAFVPLIGRDAWSDA